MDDDEATSVIYGLPALKIAEPSSHEPLQKHENIHSKS